MKRSSFVTTLAALAVAASAPMLVRADDGSATRTILLPAGTQVPVRLVSELSSGRVKDGDTFQIVADQDVVMDGFVVVRKGAGGEGAIGTVDHAGGNGHSGSLTMNFRWIASADGGRIRLSDTAQRQTEEDRKGASSTATIVGFATFGLGGLFGHNLAHGREVTVPTTKVLSSFVADSIHVQTGERASVVEYDK